MDGRAPSRGLEAALIACLGLGVLGGGAGALMALLPVPSLHSPGIVSAGIGLLLIAAALAIGVRVPSLRRLRGKGSGGTRYDRLRHWNRFRVTGLALNVLAIASGIIVLFAMGLRGGLFTAEVPDAVLDRGALALVAVLAILQAAAFGLTLLAPLETPRGGVRTVIAVLGLCLQVLLALLALAAPVDAGFFGASATTARHAELVLLAGYAAAGGNLAFLRLPPLATLLSPEEGIGPTAASRNRNILLPVLGAFALLLVVFLLFVLFGVGVFGLLTEVTRSPLLLGSIIFLVGGLILSVAVAFALSRTEDEGVALFRPARDPAQEREQLVLALSALAAALLCAAGVLNLRDAGPIDLPEGAWMHLFSIAALVGVGPYGYLKGREAKRIRRLEERFPDFLRDLASSHKGGLTLTSAVQVAARGEYGPLTPEVQKMADQIAWNVPFSEALDRFQERVRTPLVRRAVSLILQANKSGGSTTDVLLAAARDAREIKGLENERRVTMSLYTMVVYVTFFVFLAVVAVMFQRFVPQIVGAGEAVADSPLAGVEGLASNEVSLEEFRFLYFTAALVQALGDGIVAGLMGGGRVALGLRHSFVMALSTYVAFALLV